MQNHPLASLNDKQKMLVYDQNGELGEAEDLPGTEASVVLLETKNR